MSSINNISSDLLQSYVSYQAKSELKPREMFQMLSLELGGDSETITKSQLDEYISSAKDGSISISNKEYAALTTLQDNWDTISNGGDSITYSDMKNYSNILVSAVTGGISLSDNPGSLSNSSEIKDVNAYLIEHALKGIDKTDSSGATSLLQTLLTGTTDKNDDANANLIGSLINFIANFESASTIDVEA